MRYSLLNVSLAVGLLSSIIAVNGMVDLDLSGFTEPSDPSMQPASAPGAAPQGGSSAGSPAPSGPTQGAAAPLVWQDQADALKEVGVTTINESRGNWFFKKKIATDSRKLNDKINKKVAGILPLQEKFLAERGAIDTALTEFYREYGVKAGEIDERLNVVLEDLKRLEATTSPLDDQEKVLLAEAKKKKEEVAILKNDYELLQKLEDGLSKSLVTMSAQITKANAYSDQAWDFYEKIEDTLSDEGAEELLNRIHVLFDNVTAIEKYLTGEFRAFFTATSQKITQQISLIKQSVTTLKNQGIILGQKMRDLERDEAFLQSAEDAQACMRKNRENELSKRTWLSPIFDAISWVWVTIRNSIVFVYDSITGLFVSKKSPKKAEPAVVEHPMPTEQVPATPSVEGVQPPVPSSAPVSEPVQPSQAQSDMPNMPLAQPQVQSVPQLPNKPLIPMNPIPKV